MAVTDFSLHGVVERAVLFIEESRDGSTEAQISLARLNETAIDIFLKHYAAKADQQLICSIAQVCKQWDTAAQHADTGALSIKYFLCGPATIVDDSLTGDCPGRSIEDSLWRHRLADSLSSLAIWLPKYGRLVREITINGGHYYLPHRMKHFSSVASPLLQCSLQAAAGQGMRLRSFSTNVLHSRTFLRALDCASLTGLELTGSDGAALAAMLPRLNNLEHLTVKFFCHDETASKCLPDTSQLTKLTRLDLGPNVLFTGKQLPTQLLWLRLVLRENQDLTHLRHLTRLSVVLFGTLDNMKQAATLPQQLLELNLSSGWGRSATDISATEAFQLTTLRQLERLTIDNPYETASELLKLAKLPRLQQLSLTWNPEERTETGVNRNNFPATSSAWPQIHQLQQLALGNYSYNRYPNTLQSTMMGHIAAMTNLTRLMFGVLEFVQLQLPIDWCQCVSQLQKLQELEVCICSGSTYWSGQAQYLRPLTNLTKLCLQSGERDSPLEFSDADVGASLLQLTQLQWLRVPVRNTAILSDIGRLRDLRHLNVGCNLPSELQSWAGLSHLCGLKKLTTLHGCGKCSKDVMAQFWAAVHS